MSCVFRANLAEKTDGRARASSKEFVWSDCVPPKMAAMASTHVRTMLLYGSCSVRDQPVVKTKKLNYKITNIVKSNPKKYTHTLEWLSQQSQKSWFLFWHTLIKVMFKSVNVVNILFIFDLRFGCEFVAWGTLGSSGWTSRGWLRPIIDERRGILQSVINIVSTLIETFIC